MKNNKPKKPAILIGIVISLVLIIAIFAGFIYVKTTPYYSLYMLKKAIVNRDAPNVLKYLDTDSILNNMAKDVITRMDKKQPAHNKFEEHVQLAGKDVVRQLLPQLKNQMGESLTNLLQTYNNENLFSDLQKAPILALTIDVKGKTAEVRQRGKDTVSFTMTRAPEGHWRITSVNPDEFKMLK